MSDTNMLSMAGALKGLAKKEFSAVELANEKVITREEAVTRVDPAALDQLLHPTLDPKADRKIIASGLPAR